MMSAAQYKCVELLTRLEIILLYESDHASFPARSRNPYRSQITRSQLLSQYQRIAPIGLDIIAGFTRGFRRRYHLTLFSRFHKLMVKHISARTSFITPQLSRLNSRLFLNVLRYTFLWLAFSMWLRVLNIVIFT
uniref:Uncharacterized protein n=1 Tax=Candidatus Kentrum sp. TUN TaxID=2126343 RepID=A0A451AN46_9GAMM|nr:MAG: hypothetical protein BECKTUN1418F_GA0071002_11527 [Candidatus Kentron sp. TUN]VFK67466.1 MAG: hypothetical protein BECKTUN1418E_GA0071001_11487 [Candidatus Kentron sp. TUN]